MDENNQAILLLAAHFSPSRRGNRAPLTPTEYGRLAFWLHENGFQPKDFLYRFKEVQLKWKDPKGKITAERLRFLLGRGMAMGVALDKWGSAGIWILTRADPQYPERLKKHLTLNAPPILFGVGNQQLLNTGGLAIVGSRNIDRSDKEYTQKIASQASSEGLNIVSGGARGVDETAMLAALESGGTALGILANDLLKAALSGKWRKYIKGDQLTFVSSCYPEASFQTGNAMGRNKYIYCISDYTLVVRSDEGKGGTWAGAKENLKRRWVPLFVRDGSDCTGNNALTELGASPLAISDEEQHGAEEWLRNKLVKSNMSDLAADSLGPDEAQQDTRQSRETNADTIFYHLFKKQIEEWLEKQNQISLTNLRELHSDLTQKQITNWLDRAVEDEILERKGKKRIYTRKANRGKQQGLFGNGQ